MSFRVVIPARYGSVRLPGKALVEIGGQALIAHVIARAADSGAAEIVVATDDERIAGVARRAGAVVVMTRADHACGTDRIAEAVATRAYDDEVIVVNLQGDEPLMPGEVIRQVGRALDDADAEMATIAAPIDGARELTDPNVVKVVCDATGLALYFSRAVVPWDRDRQPDAAAALLAAPRIYRRHLGLYACRVGFLRRFAALPPCPLEEIEKLEQLRALYHGARIRVLSAAVEVPAGVDTPGDLEAVRRVLAARSDSGR